MVTRQQAAEEVLKRRRERREAETLAGFTKQGWHVLEPGAQLKWGWALDAICEHLEAVTYGHLNRLLITVPPGMMKSLLTGVFWTAWEWGPKEMPWVRYLGTSHKQDLAIRDSQKTRTLIKSEWYQSRFAQNWSINPDQDQKVKFENTERGFREAMSFTSLTGSRGHRVGIDDPLSVDDARSPTVLQQVAETFTEAVPSRLNDPARDAIVMIMQRLHERDPAGIIMEEGLNWPHLNLPMEFEPDRKCYTSIGFEDPRTEPDELLFPERFSRETVERDKKVMMSVSGPYAVAGQFQQRPSPRGGGLFKRDDLKIVDFAPAGTRWARGWDLAATDNNTAAYTAGALVGISPAGKIYVGDMVRFRGDPFMVEKTLVATAKSDGYMVPGSLPQDPGQSGKFQVNYLVSKLLGYDYTFSTESGDKATRAAPLAAQAAAGNVFLVAGTWNNAFLSEAETFPAGRYKDQVDACSRAFARLLESSALEYAL